MSATLGAIVSRAAATPFPLEVDKLREIAVPKTRNKTTSTFQYAFAMCNGRQIAAFYHTLNSWRDEWESTLVCLIDAAESEQPVTVKHNEDRIRQEVVCHVSDEHTDVLIWPTSIFLGVYNHKLELLRREAIFENGRIAIVAANSQFIFLAQWNYGKYELSIRRLDTLEHVARIDGPLLSEQHLQRLFANNDHLFVVTGAKEKVLVVELASLTQGGQIDDNSNWVMRTYETPEFCNSQRLFLSGYSLVYYDGHSKQFSLDGRDGKRRERTDEDGPSIRVVTQSGESVLFIDCSECADEQYHPTIYIRM